jgi:hypothetical protein
LCLRAVESVSNEVVAEIEGHSGSRHWFLNVPGAATDYLVQLGYYQPDGEWKSIRESAVVSTPPDRVSGERNGRAMSRPSAELQRRVRETDDFPRIPIEEILARIGKFVAERQGEGGGHRETIKTPVLPEGAGEKETSARLRRMYAEIYGVEDLSELTAPSSFELMAAAELISSPMGRPQPRGGFWFNVDAELIVYGATEPDAQVTMGGRPIQLRPDGTFTCRFALPDGDHALPLAATSADRREVRYAELRVRRESECGAQGG